jgi:hypothetical protein
MPPDFLSLPSQFKSVEDLLNSNDDHQTRLVSDPVSFFQSINIDISDKNSTLLNQFALFMKEKVSIADPVTMIYE